MNQNKYYLKTIPPSSFYYAISNLSHWISAPPPFSPCHLQTFIACLLYFRHGAGQQVEEIKYIILKELWKTSSTWKQYRKCGRRGGGGDTLKNTDQVELNFLSWIQGKLKFRFKHITSENIFYK